MSCAANYLYIYVKMVSKIPLSDSRIEWTDLLVKSRIEDVFCNAGGFHKFFNGLPMASEFKSFSNFGCGLMALYSGSSYIASLDVNNAITSKSVIHLSGVQYCGPYCLAFSYIVSVNIRSFTSSRINVGLRSYFLEKYKKNWLAQN